MCCHIRANEVYTKANCQFCVRNRDVLMNAHFPHKWRSTLYKSAVFGSSSSLPPLAGGGGGTVRESIGKGLYAVKQFLQQVVQGVLICRSLHQSPIILPLLPSSRERYTLAEWLRRQGGSSYAEGCRVDYRQRLHKCILLHEAFRGHCS